MNSDYSEKKSENKFNVSKVEYQIFRVKRKCQIIVKVLPQYCIAHPLLRTIFASLARALRH